MSVSTLGKRSRSTLETVTEIPQTPSKRTRRTTKPIIYDEENQDPNGIALDVDELLSSRQKPTPKFNPVTPTTPRHRDVFSSPSTPRHVVMSAGKLFRRLTPSTPLSPSTVQTIYHSARQLFAHGTEPGKLIGRDSERAQLSSFLERCSPSSSSPSGCLYVSGPPGTGKSAMITEIMQGYEDQESVRAAYVNCMSIKSSRDLYKTLLEELGHASDLTEEEAVSTLQSVFCPKKQTSSSAVYLVTLDEIDHILTMGLDSLYRMFEWSLQKSSRLVLVGIANALDLTDRFLPRLKAKNLKPDLLPFLPYTAIQIKQIVTTRLKSLMPADGKEGYLPFIHPAAIELCSRKVASQTGDLRKAFEICRRALDLIEQETRSKHEDEAREKFLQLTPSKRPLGEKVNGASGNGSQRSVAHIMAQSLKTLTAETAPRASIGHLNKVTAAAFNNGTTQRLRTLNLQQKAALCALVAYERRARASSTNPDGATPSKSQTLAPSVRILFDTYCRLCTRDSVLHPLSGSEFREVVGSLETLGLVNAVDGKTGSFVTPQTPSKRGRRSATVVSGDDRRIASAAAEKEMEAMVDGIGAGILRSILSGEALD